MNLLRSEKIYSSFFGHYNLASVEFEPSGIAAPECIFVRSGMEDMLHDRRSPRHSFLRNSFHRLPFTPMHMQSSHLEQFYDLYASISKYYFLRKAHSTEQTLFTRMFPSGTHFLAESTETMRTKCLDIGNIPRTLIMTYTTIIIDIEYVSI